MPRRRPPAVRILALHGTVADPSIWDDCAHHCRDRDLELLAPDVRELSRAVGGGFGSLIRALAATAPGGPLVVVGCGIGANLAAEVAAVLGERVRGVLCINPCPLAADETFRERVRSLVGMFAAMAPTETRRFAPILLHSGGPGYRRAVPQVERMLEATCGEAGVELIRLCAAYPDTGPALARISAPVRVIFGAETVNPFHGEACEREWERAVASLPGGSFERLPAVGSLAALEAPDVVAEILRALAARPSRS